MHIADGATLTTTCGTQPKAREVRRKRGQRRAFHEKLAINPDSLGVISVCEHEMMPTRPPTGTRETGKTRNGGTEFAVTSRIPAHVKSNELVPSRRIRNIGLYPAVGGSCRRFDPESRADRNIVVLLDPGRDGEHIVRCRRVKERGIRDLRGGQYCASAE